MFITQSSHGKHLLYLNYCSFSFSGYRFACTMQFLWNFQDSNDAPLVPSAFSEDPGFFNLSFFTLCFKFQRYLVQYYVKLYLPNKLNFKNLQFQGTVPFLWFNFNDKKSMIDEEYEVQRIHSLRVFSSFSETSSLGLINKTPEKSMKIQLAEFKIEEVVLVIEIFYNVFTQPNQIQTFFDLYHILVVVENIKNKKIFIFIFQLTFNLIF